MNKQLESGVGKKVYLDYVMMLEKYLAPFFGKMHVTSITCETPQKCARWREHMSKAYSRFCSACFLNNHQD